MLENCPVADISATELYAVLGDVMDIAASTSSALLQRPLWLVHMIAEFQEDESVVQ